MLDTNTSTTMPLDNGMCPYAWSASDANIVKRVSAWYAPMDMSLQGGSWVAPYLGPANALTASTAQFLSPVQPKVFLEGGTTDTTVDVQRDIDECNASHAAGRACTISIVTNGGHFLSPLWKVIQPPGYPAPIDVTDASCTNDAFMQAL